MESYQFDDLQITLDKRGAREFTKVSYPLRYGRYAEIRTPEHIFQFNLNGEIRFVLGRGKDWPDPSEWLKRTVTNDWIYYSTGGYSGVYDSFGEYYVPCLPYPSNSINLRDPFNDKDVMAAMDAWSRLHERINVLYCDSLPDSLRTFLGNVLEHSPHLLGQKAGLLHKIIQDTITVLPPDARHVDYDVIPIIVADGCLYKCSFCRIKSSRKFQTRSR